MFESGPIRYYTFMPFQSSWTVSLIKDASLQ